MIYRVYIREAFGRKLTVEIDGSDKYFIDNVRKFINRRKWLILETENITLKLGENTFRISLLKNTTNLIVSKSSMANKTAPIQVKSFGQWKPLDGNSSLVTETSADIVSEKVNETSNNFQGEKIGKSQAEIAKNARQLREDFRLMKKRQRNAKKRRRKRS